MLSPYRRYLAEPFVCPYKGLPNLGPYRRLRFSQERGIGVARLSESPSSEARMIAECALCTRLSSEGIHSSIAFSIAAVLTTSWLASTSSVNCFCCSSAVSSSTGLTQLKEAHTVLPSPPSSSNSSRASRLMRQCLPTLRQGSFPSLHHL